MLRSYLTTALRALRRDRGFALINILGLAVGMAVCLLILLIPIRQWRMDRFHEYADRVHRVLIDPPLEAFGLSASNGFASTPAPLAPLMRRTHTGVEAAVRMSKANVNLMRGDHRVVFESEDGIRAKGLYVEPSFFDVFDGFQIESGSAQQALRSPYSVILTRRTARKLFGENDPRGRTVRLAGTGDFTVTGVLAEPAGRSHLDFEALFSFSTLHAEGRSLSAWSDFLTGGDLYYTYLLLEKGSDAQAVEAQLRPTAERLKGTSGGFNPQTDFESNPFSLQPLLGIALHPPPGNEIARPMLSPMILRFLAGLALVIVLAAGFNYANLSIARSLTRAREVGVRRTMGATRWQIGTQFLGEAVLTSLLALGVAYVLLQALLPLFNGLHLVQLMAAPVSPSMLRDGAVLLAFIGFSVTVGLCSGAYPALALSRFRPTEVLREGGGSGGRTGRRPFRLRRLLTGGQLVLSLLLMVAGVLAYQQARHAMQEIGIETQHLVTVGLDSLSYETFRNEARGVPGVRAVMGASPLPASGWVHRGSVRLVGTDRKVAARVYAVEHAVLGALGLSFADGRAPSPDQFSKGRGLVMNAAAVRKLGLSNAQKARGQRVELDGVTYRIVGIVENIHLRSMGSSSDAPVLFYPGTPSDFDHALVRVAPGTTERVAWALAALGPLLGTTKDLTARSYDDLVYMENAMPYDEGARVVGMAALLAALVSCLGLLGMVTYAVETRRREVAVRKAVGASAWDITALLSKNFLILIGIAMVVGAPLAWWLNSLWLQRIPSRVAIGLPTIAGCAVALVGLTLATVGVQALRAAHTNPTDALRAE